MRCGDVESLLLEFLEGELAPEVEEEALEHVAGCPACELYLAEYADTIELVARWGGEVLEPGTANRILAAVISELA